MIEPIGITVGDVKIELSFQRAETATNKAQYWLDSQVMTDVIPFMPFQTGNFVQRSKAQSEAWAGTGKVCVGVPPMGRFLYEGILMVGEESGSPWAMAGERKVVTDQPLQFTQTFHPEAQNHWFDPAKAAHLQEWIDGAKKIVGDELNG
jgi:hypothetical protein